MENIIKDRILIIEIDNAGRLHIKPEMSKFTLIYRTATEVHWDKDKRTLYSPKPREWNYLDWFIHITGVAKADCNTDLIVTDETKWVNVPDDLKKKITKAQHRL
jgi:DNA-binding transcriptional regulator/RsmH inhibitor MraZ